MSTGPSVTDYVVVGTGPTAMAFVDTLLSETGAQVVMVDRHHRPGGQWNDAYSFVRLHQASATYGVTSRELGSGERDRVGFNEGLYEMAAGPDILRYYDEVMRQRFLPSGRVRWLPMSEYRTTEGGVHQVRSLLTGEEHRFVSRRKLVDATHARTEVPSTHKPRYDVSADVSCIPINQLPNVGRPHRCYTVVGSGKTGMDACLWLLQNGVDPDRIRWIMPRDAWMMNRVNLQPGIENFDQSMGATIASLRAIVDAGSIADLFARLEASEILLRIDRTVEPTRYRCATISRPELEELRRIRNIVRLGHVVSIAPERIMLERGELSAERDTIYIDCSASAIQMPPSIPVFDLDRINLLMVRWCQPVFSAALIAFVESHVEDEAEKNALCGPVPSPERPVDWLRMWGPTLANSKRWQDNEMLREWVPRCRLDGVVNSRLRGMKVRDERIDSTLAVFRETAAQAAARMPQLLSTWIDPGTAAVRAVDL